MKFTKRIFTAVLLTICLLFNCVAFAGNAVVMTEEERAKLFDDLICQRDLAVIQGDTEKVEELNRQLFALGMEELTTADMLQKENFSEVSPLFVTPSTTNISWSSQRYKYDDTSTGKSYEIQIIYASPVNGTTNNLREITGELIKPTTTFDAEAACVEVLKVGAGTLISSFPGLAGKVGTAVVTIYDLITAIGSGREPATLIAQGARTSYLMDNFTTVRLAFVKEYGESDDFQELRFIATRCATEVTVTAKGDYKDAYVSPRTFSTMQEVFFTTQASKYNASLKTIVANYLTNSTLRSYVSSVPIYYYVRNEETSQTQQHTIYEFHPLAPENIGHIVY